MVVEGKVAVEMEAGMKGEGTGVAAQEVAKVVEEMAVTVAAVAVAVVKVAAKGVVQKAAVETGVGAMAPQKAGLGLLELLC